MIGESDRKALKRSAQVRGGLFAGIGAAAVFASNYVGVWLALIGVFLACFGIVIIAKGAEFGEMYVAKKKIAELKSDNEGIVWVWIVALLTWAIMAIAYFALSIVVYMVLDSVEASGYAFDDQYLANIQLTRNVTAWFLVIMTVGILGWALISSARRVDDTAPSF